MLILLCKIAIRSSKRKWISKPGAFPPLFSFYLSSLLRSRYSRSINASTRFLIISGLGRNRELSCFVTSPIKRLCSMVFRSFMIRTIAASIWCFLSSSTLSWVCLRSPSDSTRLATVWILIRARLAVKASLKINLSPGLTSRPLDSLSRILNFAHASDCKVRLRSWSGIWVWDWISYNKR